MDARSILYEYGYPLIENNCESSTQPLKSSKRLKAENGEEEMVFAIYPNPAKEQFTIDYLVNEDERIIIELIDVTGRLVKSRSLFSGFNHQINTSDLQQGLYIVHLLDDNGKVKEANKLFIAE